jgi:hypothetical protein
LLPLLATYNPNIRETLRRTADVVAAEVEILRDASGQAWRIAVISETGRAVTFNLAIWRDLPSALQRATLREAILPAALAAQYQLVHVDDAESGKPARTDACEPQRLMLSVDYDTFHRRVRLQADLPGWPLLGSGRS